MSSVEVVLRRIAHYFDTSIDLDQLENDLDTLATDPAVAARILQLACVQTALTHPAVLNELLELSNECSALFVAQHQCQTPSRSVGSPTPSCASQTPSGWQHMIDERVVELQPLLGYFTCLVLLAQLRPGDPVARRIGFMAARTYLLLLTVPDAQVFGVFHAPLVQRCFALLDLLAVLLKSPGKTSLSSLAARDNAAAALPLKREHEKIDVLMSCAALLDDCGKMMQMVALADHPDVRRALVRASSAVLLHYFEMVHRSRYSLQLYEQSFQLFESLCQSRHGNIDDTLMAVLRGTVPLNRFGGRQHVNNGAGTRPKYDTLSAWFIEKLTHFPSQTAAVLTHFVQAILTNPELSAGAAEVLAANLEVCVQYETAMWQRGNGVLLEFVTEELALRRDIGMRLYAMEFAVRLLAVESSPAATTTTDEVDGDGVVKVVASREVRLLRLLLEKMLDVSNNVKMKAIAGFLRLVEGGNSRLRRVLKLVFMHKSQPETNTNQNQVETDISNDDDNDDDEPIASFQNQSPPKIQPLPAGIETLYEYRDRLLQITRHNLTNASALVRKAAVQLLEFLAQSDVALDAFLGSRQMRALHADTSPMVRRQLILTGEAVLHARSDSEAVIEAYVRLTLDLAADDDPKVADTVADSYKRNLFDNIVPVSRAATKLTKLPWRLLRTMLSGSDLPDVRACIGGWVHKKLLTPKILEHIETHTQTSRSNEAWILLSMVSSHIGSKQSAFVFADLLKNVQSKDPVAIDVVYSQLEVLANWLDKLDHSSHAEIFRIFNDLLGFGSVAPRNVQRVFEICTRIRLSPKNGNNKGDGHQRWAESLSQQCLTYVHKQMRSLLIGNLNVMRLISYLYVYTEAVTAVPTAKSDEQVVGFLLKFLEMVAARKIKYSNDKHLAAKVNTAQIVLTKLSLFDYEVCLRTVPTLGRLLRNTTQTQPNVIVTTIACLSDLYKKNTSQAGTVLHYMLAKTRHANDAVRVCALQNITGLIIDEYIKFRGSLLVYTLAALVDRCAECSELATELVLKFRAEKNLVIMRSCMLECPFVLNGYMHLDNMELFCPSESSLPSPMLGDEHRADRQYVYRFLVHCVDATYCYEFFDKVRLVDHQLKHRRDTMETAEGRAAVRDFLYVLTYICRSKEKSKRKIGDGLLGGGGDGEGDDGEENRVDGGAAAVAAATAAEATGTTKPGAGRGRGGARNAGPTMEHALLEVEKVLPLIADLANVLCSMDASFAADIDLLGHAMCEHFAALTHYAQPQQFWNKYKAQQPGAKNAKAMPKSGRRRGPDDSDDDNGVNSSSSDADDDDAGRQKNDWQKPTASASVESGSQRAEPIASTTRGEHSNDAAEFKRPAIRRSVGNRSAVGYNDDSEDDADGARRANIKPKQRHVRRSSSASSQSEDESDSDRRARLIRMARKRR